MPRSKMLVVAAAALGAIGAVVAGLAVTCDDGGCDAPGTSVASVRNATPAAAQHGGTVLKQGDLALEYGLAGKPGDARLVAYLFADGKPVAQGATLSGAITRYDGTRAPLRFELTGQKFTSTEPIAKPHVFDATLEVAWRGRLVAFPIASAEGALTLTDAQLKAARITLADAGSAQIASSFQLPGEIRFNGDRTAHLVPRVAGIVERVAVTTGQQVAQGQLLAVIASPDLADRRSELLSAERRLVAVRQSYAREQALWQERISAEQDYQQAQVQLREAEIAVQNARQKLAALNAPASASALNRYELRSPLAGTIVERHVTPGEAVAADASLFLISDLGSVWAELAVPAQRLDDVRVGWQATVSAVAFQSNSRGTVNYVGALLGEQTRTATARVVLPNPDGAWRPGMFVNVAVDQGVQRVSVAVAGDALQTIDGAPSVFVRSPKGWVAQPIETGRRDGSFVEVLKGLAAGQQYAATNSFVLKAELEKGSAGEE
jgi:cobalt-zinc-cadmium efflux system membrane fusion protein